MDVLGDAYDQLVAPASVFVICGSCGSPIRLTDADYAYYLGLCRSVAATGDRRPLVVVCVPCAHADSFELLATFPGR